MVNFLIGKWVKKTIQAAITALLAYLAQPEAAKVLAEIGVTIDPAQAQAGIWVVLLSLANFLKHQKWVPEAVKKII